MKRLALVLLFACHNPAQNQPTKQPSLEGSFLLKNLAKPNSTKPEMFSAEDWAKGLMLPQQPSTITIEKGGFSSGGVLSLSGDISGQVRGNEVIFSIAEEDEGTRLELQFTGSYNTSTDEIVGRLTQQWGLTGEEDSGGVTLSADATFTRKK